MCLGPRLCPQPAVRHEACNGLYKLSLSGLEGGESINRSFLLLAASTLLKFLPDAQALKPLRVGATHTHTHTHTYTQSHTLIHWMHKVNLFAGHTLCQKSSGTMI